MVEESFQVLLHLDRVVFRLGDAENPHFAIFPSAMLLQEERQQHEQPAVVHDPPDVDVALDLVARVRIPLHAFGHQYGHFGRSRIADRVNEDPPRVLLLLAPRIGPPENDGVGFHAPEAGGLDPILGRNSIMYFI